MADNFRLYVGKVPSTGKLQFFLTDGDNYLLDYKDGVMEKSDYYLDSPLEGEIKSEFKLGQRMRISHRKYSTWIEVSDVQEVLHPSRKDIMHIGSIVSKAAEEWKSDVKRVTEEFLPRYRAAERSRLLADWETAIIENEERAALRSLKTNTPSDLDKALFHYLKKV